MRPTSLRQWQGMFASIYAQRNRRLYTSADLLLHMIEETAIIAEALRKENLAEIPKAIGHFFGWFCAFCTQGGLDLGQVVFEKYQGICPYCGKRENCICISEETKPRKWRRNSKGKIPLSLGGWQTMFDKIYGRINRVAGRERVWFHVNEELGEASQAFRLEEVGALKREIADIFAWFVAFCNQLSINLSDAIWKVYPYRCDVCRQKKCCCPKV